MKSLYVLAIAAALGCTQGCVEAWAGEKAIKIGILGDQSGPYSDLGGPGSVLAAQMAADDYGGNDFHFETEAGVARDLVKAYRIERSRQSGQSSGDGEH